jgi:hypothetical protein
VADPIENWRIQQYRDRVQQDLQEKGGRMRAAVTHNSGYIGKGAREVITIGPSRARKVTERYGDSPHMEVPMGGRWIYPTGYEWGHLIDDIDRVMLGMQPDGELQTAGTNAMRTAEDEEILTSMWAPARTGEDGSVTTPWPTANLIPATDAGASSASGMTIDKLRAARKMLKKYWNDLDNDPLYMILTENEEYDLFGTNVTISADFVDGRPVSTGVLPRLMGFNFITFSSTTLANLGLISGQITSLPAWVRSGMHLGTWRDLRVNVGPDPSKKFNQRIYMLEQMGATRLDENKVIKVQTSH